MVVLEHPLRSKENREICRLVICRWFWCDSASSDASSSRRRQEEILEKQLLLSSGGNGHADDEDHANKSDDGWKTVNVRIANSSFLSSFAPSWCCMTLC